MIEEIKQIELNQDFYDNLIKEIKPYFNGDGGHGFDHTQRVYNLALNISENEDADLDIIKAASLLHDVARMKEEENETICHADEGAKMAKEILKEMDFPEDKIDFKYIYSICIIVLDLLL